MKGGGERYKRKPARYVVEVGYKRLVSVLNK